MGIWIVPALGYVVSVGMLGIMSKLAFRDVTWQTLVVYSTVFYVIVSAALLVTGQAHIRFQEAGLLPAATGMLPVIGLLCLYIALHGGPANRVIPFTSIYPALTVLLAILILHEQITVPQAAGVGLIVAGAVLVTI